MMKSSFRGAFSGFQVWAYGLSALEAHLGSVTQYACLAVFKDYDIFDSDAAPTGDVDAGLDCEGHSVLQR